MITVLMPAYNAAGFVMDAIDSILWQTYKDFELLIIDDGSTDDTHKLISSFKDKRIRIVSNGVNKGLITTLNEGLLLAQGKYIARMDSDDIALPDRLADQIEFMEANPDIAACGSYYRTFGYQHVTVKHPTDSQKIHNDLLFVGSMLGHPTVMMRTEFLRRHKLQYPKEFIHTEDYAMWVEIDRLGKLVNIPKIHLLYRNHEQQITTAKRDEQAINCQRIKLQILTRMVSLNQKESELVMGLLSNGSLTSFGAILRTGSVIGRLVKANSRKQDYPKREFLKFLYTPFLNAIESYIARNEQEQTWGQKLGVALANAYLDFTSIRQHAKEI